MTLMTLALFALLALALTVLVGIIIDACMRHDD